MKNLINLILILLVLPTLLISYLGLTNKYLCWLFEIESMEEYPWVLVAYFIVFVVVILFTCLMYFKDSELNKPDNQKRTILEDFINLFKK
jgi:hypothetical protein